MNLRKAYETLRRRYCKWVCSQHHEPGWDGKIGWIEAGSWLAGGGIMAYVILSFVIALPELARALIEWLVEQPVVSLVEGFIVVVALVAAVAFLMRCLFWLNSKWIVHECDLKGRDAMAAEIPAFLRRGGELEPPPGGKVLEEAVGTRQEGI